MHNHPYDNKCQFLKVYNQFLAAAIVFFLPTLAEYFGDQNIINLVKEGKIIDFFINHDNYVIVQTCATMESRMWHKENFIKLIIVRQVSSNFCRKYCCQRKKKNSKSYRH
mgnify:CR=1 FL=1